MADFLKLKSDGGNSQAVERWKNLAQHGEEVWLDVAEEVANYFLLELRRNADEAGGDWPRVASEVTVGRTKQGVGFILPFEAALLEWGRPDAGIRAQPVLRHTISQQNQGATKRRFSNLMHDRLWRRD